MTRNQLTQNLMVCWQWHPEGGKRGDGPPLSKRNSLNSFKCDERRLGGNGLERGKVAFTGLFQSELTDPVEH